MIDKKTILVTGAANGIGRSISLYLASKDYFVFAADVDDEGLKSLENTENVKTINLDIQKTEEIDRAFNETANLVEGLDGLVNSAGIFIGGPMLEISIEDMRAILEINVLAMIEVTQKFFPLLHKRKGKIINLSSEVGRFSYPFNGPYGISKHAVEAFSDSLRRELMFEGMKVIKIQPGAFNTRFMKETEDEYKKYINESMFKDQISRIWPVLAKEKMKSSNPIIIAKLVHKILMKKHPRSCYKVKINRSRLILEYLPTPLADFLIKHFI
ncbi:MAG: SDR family NAD(P)-dependent oxidoreductase [Candidatus Heimdallarchaeota archaeon]|nr:SDR family NAD(P)-dependent oxidoreductase [Candidatus Heimdallarchaeota archaeon]